MNRYAGEERDWGGGVRVRTSNSAIGFHGLVPRVLVVGDQRLLLHKGAAGVPVRRDAAKLLLPAGGAGSG